MRVDDDNSIYVGSLPYSATEDTIRRVFGPYGSIVSVKIINDHGTRGKCYCFVTFRNPRSVSDAINDMNGKTIDGRVVRVNGVTTRGGRTDFSRERLRCNTERSLDRGRDRERDYDRDRDWFREQYSDRSREHGRSLDRGEDGDRRHELAHDHDRARDVYQSQDRVMVDNEPVEGRNGDRSWERGHNLHMDQEREHDGTNGDRVFVDMETDQHSRKLNDSRYTEHHSREISSDSNDDGNNEVEERLEISIQRRNELKREVSQMEKRLEDKQQSVSKLQKRTRILEDDLIMAKKRSSQHNMLLMKLHKCFLQVKEYSERRESCEKELQSLVDSAMIQSDLADDVDIWDGFLINSNA
ncbi:zinc finger CCCH domain-containing protein 25 [Ricinus communis]|uniref:zinc finger CCCH domain-containing protein 25 n=1 Tax=Ricinus communis TaxID=3988 RepID=UPI00201AFE32|nr:zinc finger CCCH domain-containing protein 25 [Ricinus communis]